LLILYLVLFSAALSNLVRRCSDTEEKYTQSKADLSQTSAFLDNVCSSNSSLNAHLDSEKMAYEVNSLDFDAQCCSCLQEEKRALIASHDNLDRLYHDVRTSLTILERSHRFTMSDLDHHHDKLRASHMKCSDLVSCCIPKIL
jgi:hypothetical protein